MPSSSRVNATAQEHHAATAFLLDEGRRVRAFIRVRNPAKPEAMQWQFSRAIWECHYKPPAADQEDWVVMDHQTQKDLETIHQHGEWRLKTERYIFDLSGMWQVNMYGTVRSIRRVRWNYDPKEVD